MAERKTNQTQKTTTDTSAGGTTELDRVEAERQKAILEKVDASTMEAAPADQQGPTGSSFYNPATVGSGTILPDGTYGAPLPDPNVEKLAKLKDEAAKDSDTAK